MRVAVRAGGLNPVDARRRAGTFPANAPLALGSEFSGTVLESTDPRWKPGDAVVGWRAPGSDGDLVVTSGDLLAAKPDDVSWSSATGVGCVGQTAMTALKDVPMNARDTIVVHGASGGVGSVLVQLAVARGITVIAMASPTTSTCVRSGRPGRLQVMIPWSTEKVAAITPIMRTNLVWKSRSRAGASSSPEAYPATTVAVDVLRATLTDLGLPFAEGRAWTTDGIYRETPGRIAARVEEGCLTVDMEASAVAAVARFRGVPLAQVLYGGDDLTGEVWDERGWQDNHEVRDRLIRVAATAALRLEDATGQGR